MSVLRSRMKQTIDALKVKPYSKKELMSALGEQFTGSQEALRKSCERDLKRLQNLGLIDERNGKYCWYIYMNDFKSCDGCNAKLLHSRKLVPALRRIAGIYVSRYSNQESNEFESLEDTPTYNECAENHLRVYPEIWARFNTLRRFRERAEQEKEKFNSRLMNKLESKSVKLVKSSKGIKPESFAMDSIPSFVYSQILNGRPLPIEVGEDGKIWLGNSLVAVRKIISNRVRKFVEREIMDESNIAQAHHIRGIEMDAFNAQPSFQQEVRKLIMRIESGEPLLGECDTCPNVCIRANTA